MIKIIAVVLTVAAGSWAANQFTDNQLNARFYFDLGSDTIDVSSYPKQQQKNYKVFAKTCSQCHALARPINAPVIARKDWRRFIDRMHFNAKVRPWAKLPQKDTQQILDFLTYDARVRKVHGKAQFEAETKRLQSLFAEVQVEKTRRQTQDDQKKIKQPPPDNGASNPQRSVQ
jgi:hypothetical protein